MSPSKREDILAVDLGGTQLRVARVDPGTGSIGHRRQVETPHDGPAAIVSRVVELIDEIALDLPDDQPIGMASPGPLDPRRGITHRLPNLPGFERFPLAAALHEASGRPCYLHNDASLAALGEAWVGAGQGADPLLYVTWSTGIGGGLVSRGEIFSGARGLAGEIGHIVVCDGGPPCALGHPGCAEALASGSGIAARAAERFGRFSTSKPEPGTQSPAPSSARSKPPPRQAADKEASRPAFDGGSWTAELVLRRAAEGDSGCQELIDDAVRAFALALAAAINLCDPRRVVIGGGVALHAWDRLMPAVHQHLPELTLAWPARHLQILRAGLGDDSGLIGAARHADQQRSADR